jgi:hypothetical protein
MEDHREISKLLASGHEDSLAGSSTNFEARSGQSRMPSCAGVPRLLRRIAGRSGEELLRPSSVPIKRCNQFANVVGILGGGATSTWRIAKNLGADISAGSAGF